MYIQLLSFFSDATLLYRVQYFSIHKSSEESHWRTLWIDTVSGNPFTLDKSNTSKNGTTTTPTTYKLIAKSPPQVTNNYAAT